MPRRGGSGCGGGSLCAAVSLRYACSVDLLHTMATRLVADVIAFLGIPLLIVSEVREADIGVLVKAR